MKVALTVGVVDERAVDVKLDLILISVTRQVFPIAESIRIGEIVMMFR